jgi:hypothetical protein
MDIIMPSSSEVKKYLEILKDDKDFNDDVVIFRIETNTAK